MNVRKMKNAMTIFRIMRTDEFATIYRTCYKRYCTAEKRYTTQKVIHPYLKIHPWKSENEFVNSLLKNVIYNADGIVAINKPYGIQVLNEIEKKIDTTKRNHNIVGAVNYSIQNVLPYLAKELDVPTLIPYIGAEKYTSGIYIFGINDKACQQIDKARKRVPYGKYRKYWVVTIRIPNEIKGDYRLAMVLQKSDSEKKPVIVTQWSKNDVKRNNIKILNVNHKIISNSTHNASSLIEIEISTRKWYAVRLFASTMLYSPILGDNYHGSRVQKIMDTWVKVNVFAESCQNMPMIDQKLLQLLNIKKNQQEIIPTHTHLRSIKLLSFGEEKKDIVLEAPLIHPFDWTCKQLMFKNIPCEMNSITMEDKAKLCN